ncbi:MAG: histidine--tRNA ligase [Candidatus Micrarchaeota archaeon]
MSEKLSDELLQPVRGARDFSGDEKMRRDDVVATLKGAFELFGFEPLETPAMERLEVLTSKFAGGEEILREVFKATDQGGRELGLRYDLTVPLCRFMAANPRMPMPFKRYAIAHVWRDGPLKAGRYREFYQCDADIVGAGGMIADAELLSLAAKVFRQLFPGNFVIKFGNRKILDGILQYAGIGQEKWLSTILIIDKLSKIGLGGVEKELQNSGMDKKQVEKIVSLISLKGRSSDILEKLGKTLGSEIAKQGIAETKELLSFSESMGFAKYAEFDPSLARGLNYYTSSIFEVYLLKGKISSSLAAGGRYDELIGKFSGAREKIPAVGISFGLDVICEALKELQPEKKKSPNGFFIIPLTNEKDSRPMEYSLELASALREKGFPSAIDLLSRNLGKNLEFTSKKGFRFAIIIGDKELAAGKVRLRDLVSGEEKSISASELGKAAQKK